MLLTAQRLVAISKWNGSFSLTNYLIAATALSMSNEYKEIPKVYHLAMMMSEEPNNDDESLNRTVNTVLSMYEKELQDTNSLIFERKHHMPTGERSNIFESMYEVPSERQRKLTKQFREALLKTIPLAGIPKAINSLLLLSSVTPASLTPSYQSVPRSGTTPQELFPDIVRTINSENHVDRGMAHWNHLYGKVSGRVINKLNRAYPDLWYSVMAHGYGPVLSFSDILDARETSLIIIASLVPQDVNIQLWGHLKGALNLGCTEEDIENARSLSIEVARWCGVKWKGDVVKL
ncbi:hypothetical protein C6P41_000058 [Kluyveromyces marxianus]|nr:hypothetical protein C6P43_001176 [Kluyveromyces marxianus]KAG0686192.1 hypothetical protein C6P41_000058 [Kluyveromyces marxianus]